jgi:hypothetical protein
MTSRKWAPDVVRSDDEWKQSLQRVRGIVSFIKCS